MADIGQSGDYGSIQVSGLDSIETARRCRSTAARSAAATGGQVGDDVTRARVRIDARGEEGRWGRRRQALEHRQIAAHVGA